MLKRMMGLGMLLLSIVSCNDKSKSSILTIAVPIEMVDINPYNV